MPNSKVPARSSRLIGMFMQSDVAECRKRADELVKRARELLKLPVYPHDYS